jgi:hypothetical protein
MIEELKSYYLREAFELEKALTSLWVKPVTMG